MSMNTETLVGHAEVECVDCGCDLIFDPELAQQRCDTCEWHHHRLCGTDCPVICDTCKEHHFVENRCA